MFRINTRASRNSFVLSCDAAVFRVATIAFLRLIISFLFDLKFGVLFFVGGQKQQASRGFIILFT